MGRPASLAGDDKLIYVDEWVVTRVQNFNYEPQFTTEDTRELGNSGIVETIVDPYIPTSISMTVNDWGSVDLLSQLMGSSASGDALYSGATADRNTFTVDQDDLKTQRINLLQKVRDNTISTTTLDRTVWFPNCYIDSMSFSYSVDGLAQHTFNFMSDTERHFIHDYRDAKVTIGTYASSSTFTTTVTEATDNYLELYAVINGVIYDATTYITSWTGTTCTVTGVTLADGDQISLVYYVATPGNYSNLDSAVIGGIKGAYVVMGLTYAAVTAGTTKSLRVQSCNIDVQVNREEDKELGTQGVIGRTVRYPIEVTVSVTVNENDLKDFVERANGGTFADKDEISVSDLLAKDNNLGIGVYDDHTQTNLLYTLDIEDMRVTGRGATQDVDSRGQVTWTYRADNFSFDGNEDIGRLATAYPSDWPTT